MPNKKICINAIRHFTEIEDLLTKIAWGRTWSKDKKSALNGSHICFITEDEVVILVQNRSNQKLSLFCYPRNGVSTLANQVAAILKSHQVDFSIPNKNHSS